VPDRGARRGILAAGVQMNDSKRSPVLWVLVGCSGLLLLSMCGFTGAAAYLAMEPTASIFGQTPEADPGTAPPPDKPLPGGGGPIAPPGMPGVEATVPIHVQAVVVRTSGAAPAQNGVRCGFAVEQHPREDGSTWCRTQIACDGRLVYGGRNAGYFDCTFEAGADPLVVGADAMTTRDDGDAAMDLDTPQGSLTIRDDASGPFGVYTMDARVVEVRRAPTP